MDHIRIDPKFRRRPRPKRAGWAAREVFKFLLEVSAEFDLHGRFPPSMQDVRWLADEWANGDEIQGDLCESLLRSSLPKLLEAELTHMDGDTLVITDWDEFYKPTQSNAERQANWRQRNGRNERNAGVTAVTEPVTRNESNATTQHNTTQHNTGEKPPASVRPQVGHPTEEPGGLRQALEAAFRTLRERAEYGWRSADDNACRELLVLANGDWAEIGRRWGNGLRRTRYPTCNTLADLVKHWNAYATDEPQPAAKGRASNADKDWSKPQPVRITEFGEELDLTGGGS